MRIESIIYIFTIVVFYRLTLYYIDIKISFLNIKNYIELYIEKLEGFIN